MDWYQIYLGNAVDYTYLIPMKTRKEKFHCKKSIELRGGGGGDITLQGAFGNV